MNRRWICNDVWMDILPSFNRPQLGLKMALLSDRFDVLVDAHFDGKSELPICSHCIIFKDKEFGPKPILFVVSKYLVFPLPDHPLPNKIRFKDVQIDYIDHSVLTFIHSNKQIWDRMGTKLELKVRSYDTDQIWDIFIREIWPIFAPNIRHFGFHSGDHLDNLLRLVSPTILTDCEQLNSISSDYLSSSAIADDGGPNAISAWQALAKWLHTPAKNGQPKELRCDNFSDSELVNYFKKTFLRATTSVSYKICFGVFLSTIEPFELVNERTNEKLTMMKRGDGDGEVISDGLLKRGPIIVEETATVQQKKKDENSNANLNKVFFLLFYNDIGPLSPPSKRPKIVLDSRAQ